MTEDAEYLLLEKQHEILLKKYDRVRQALFLIVGEDNPEKLKMMSDFIVNAELGDPQQRAAVLVAIQALIDTSE